MKKIKSISYLLIILLAVNALVYSANDQFADEEARDNLQMALLEFKSTHDNFSVSEDEINVCRIAENKTLRMTITLFMMSMYGVVISGDNTVSEMKVDVIDENGKILMTKKILGSNRDPLIISAEYTGEYGINITPTKINADANDFFKTGWISWAVLYEE